MILTEWGRGTNEGLRAVYDAETEAAEFGAFARVVETWRARRPPAGFPRWRDYDIPDFRGWYGHVRLGRFTAEPFDVVFEYFGTFLSAAAGRDMTGRRLSEMATAGRVELQYLRTLRDRGGIGLADTRFRVGRGHLEATFLDLLVGKASSEPTHLLSYCRVRTYSEPEVAAPARRAPAVPGLRAQVIDLSDVRGLRG